MNAATAFLDELTAAARKCSTGLRKCRKDKPRGAQGDCYLHPIKSKPKAWSTPSAIGGHLALGNTQGSRHIAIGAGAKVWWASDLDAALDEVEKIIPGFTAKLGGRESAKFCIGPIVVRGSKPFTLDHPEHAHHRYTEKFYLTTYQLDRATMRAVRD